MSSLTAEIAASAARLVVEEGMEYGPAKRRAARTAGGRVQLPGNDEVEAEVRTYLALFCADSQPDELAALRQVAMHWMTELAQFRPHLRGAVWRGTATRLSSVHVDLFCDDPKSAELTLIDRGLPYDSQDTTGPRREPVTVLSVSSASAALGEPVTVFLHVLDHDDLRGALKPDASGQTQRGDLAALRRLMGAGA